jgi:NAD-dependent dihydropyrimidine dehydrogenase PreA subunit
VVYVDEARCTGCGLCTDVCPTGAISVVDGVARVEQSLCRECEVCLSACPNGALLALQEPARAEKPAPVRAPAPSPISLRPVAPAPRPNTGVWPWLGAALGFVGREVVPRVVALLGNRKQGQPGPALSSRAAGLPGRANHGGWGGGQRARRRRRGRR